MGSAFVWGLPEADHLPKTAAYLGGDSRKHHEERRKGNRRHVPAGGRVHSALLGNAARHCEGRPGGPNSPALPPAHLGRVAGVSGRKQCCRGRVPLAWATEWDQSSKKGAREYYTYLLICGRVPPKLGTGWRKESVGGGLELFYFLELINKPFILE